MKNRIFQKLPIIFILLAAFSFLAVEIDAQSKKDRKRAEQLVKDGDKAYSQKNFRLALDNYTQAVTLVPNDAYAHYRKGFAHYYLKELDLAIPEFDVALAKGYKPIEIYKVRWQLHTEKKNYDAAADDVRQVLKVEPNNSDFILAMAEISYERGAFKEAVDGYQKAILKTPNNGNLFYKLAVSKSNLGDFEGQAAAAEEAVKKNTQFLAESFRLIADARVRQKRMPEAIDAYERSLRSKPDVREVYRNLAELYRGENRIDDAIKISRAGLQQFTNDGNMYTDLSWYYSLAGKTSEAIDAGKAATRLLPQQALGYTFLCRAYNEGEDAKPELAISACNTALKLNPKDGETNFYLGRAYAILKRSAEAKKYNDLAITGLVEFTKSNPDYSDGFYLLGNAYSDDEQNVKALEAYNRSLELNKNFAKAQFNIGVIQVKQKNKAAATEQYNALMITNKKLAGDLKAMIDNLKL